MRGCRQRSHRRELSSQGRQTLASQIQGVVAAPTTKKDAQIEGEQIGYDLDDDTQDEFDDADEVVDADGTITNTTEKFIKISFTNILISYFNGI